MKNWLYRKSMLRFTLHERFIIVLVQNRELFNYIELWSNAFRNYIKYPATLITPKYNHNLDDIYFDIAIHVTFCIQLNFSNKTLYSELVHRHSPIQVSDNKNNTRTRADQHKCLSHLACQTQRYYIIIKKCSSFKKWFQNLKKAFH